MIKIRLVEDTMIAGYLDKSLVFNTSEVSHYVEHTNRKLFSGKDYPDITEIYFKNGECYTVLTKDLFEATK